MSNKYLLKIITMFAASAFIASAAQAEQWQSTDETPTQTQQSEVLQPDQQQQEAEGAIIDHTDEPETGFETEAGTGIDREGEAGIGADPEPGFGTEEPHTVGDQPSMEEDLYTSTDMTTTEVQRLQEELNSQIGANLQPDGVFGPLTQQALQQYQEQQGLEVTGTPNQQTMDSLGIEVQAEAVERRPAAVDTPAEDPQQQPPMEEDTGLEQQQEGLEQQQEGVEQQQEWLEQQQDDMQYEDEIEQQQESVNSEQLNEGADTF